MAEKQKPLYPYTAKMQALETAYPPVDVGAYLKLQRKWVRMVCQLSVLPHKQRVAAIFIGMFGTPDKPFCATSMKYICDHVDCERTTVSRAVADLERLGFLKVDRPKRGGNVYRICLPGS